MAMQITLASDAEQEKLGVGKPVSTVDLEAYKAPIANLATQMIGATGYSKWVKVTLDNADERKKAQRRFSQAAKALGVHVGYEKDDKQPKVLYFRRRPEPKARAKRAAGAPANGQVVNVPAAASA